jgi:hypothetical protein
MRILITGSRDWTDADSIKTAISDTWVSHGRPPVVTVVHGCARGADTIAGGFARAIGWNVEEHPAAWDTRGRAAGPIRNSEMVNAGADVCLAFIRNGSRGASNCADLAERAGIPTVRFNATKPTEYEGTP